MKHLIFFLISLIILSCDNTQLNKTPAPIKMHYEDIRSSIKTKFDHDIQIEYTVKYRMRDNFTNSNSIIDEKTNKILLDSLRHFDMYEMWATKRDSLSLMIENILKDRIPEIEEIFLSDIIIPQETEKQFLENDYAKQAMLDSLSKHKLLEPKTR